MKLDIRPLLFCVLPLLLLVAGCKDSSTGPGRVVTTILITPADPSVADGATAQLTATLRDQDGQAFNAAPPGVTVTWSSADAAVASVSGSGLVTGERPGQAVITASAGGASGSTAATVTQVATGLEPLSGDEQTGRVGEALAEALTARVVDRHGDPVPGVAVAWAVTGGGGSVGGSTSQTDAAGTARATWTLGTVPGENTLSASAAGQSVVFHATAGASDAAVLVKVSGDAQTGDAGAPLAEPLLVRVTDAFGNAVPGVTVAWAVTGGGGSVAPLSAPADMAGEARVTWTLGEAGANTVQASAGEIEGSPAAFTAEAISTNRPPVAQDDSATTAFGTPVVIDVLANDSDPDGDPLTVESVTTPANGTAAIDADQTVTYTPDAGFHGVDSFEYTINDGHGHTASATVTVTVQAPVQACNPVAGYAKTWQGSVSADWSHAGNWSPAGAPGAGDSASICPQAANQPVLSGASVASDLLVRGQLRFAGHTLSLGGDFRADQAGGLTMDGAGDRLVVEGDAAFNAGGVPPNVLSAGEIRVAGDFSVLFSRSFLSTGTRVVLDGSSPQTVSPNNPPSEFTFDDLRISNPAGVEFVNSGAVSGTVTLAAASGPVTSSGNRTVTIAGDLIDAAGGRWRVENTVFTGSPGLPAEMMTNVRFGRSPAGVRVTLAAGFATSGSVTVGWPGTNLDLNGHEVRVGGNFHTTQAGILTMKHGGDLLIVGGDAHFASSGLATDTLSAGEIRVRGEFRTSFSGSFPSTGTRVVLDGTSPQTVSIANPPTSPFHDLEITNPSGIELLSDARVNGDLNLVGQMTVPASRTLTIVGTLFLRAASVLNNQGTIQVGACDKEPGHTIIGTDPC